MNIRSVHDDERFVEAWLDKENQIHEIAVHHGWWDKERSVGEVIALIHAELSEALEGARNGDPESEHIYGYSSVEEELADVVIRIMDYCAFSNLDIANAIVEKVKFNETRPYKHGGKLF